MKIKMVLFVVVICLLVSSNVIAQEDEDPVEYLSWYFETSGYSVYVGEDFWINITGESNATFDLRFVCLTNDSYSFRQTGRIDVNGSFDMPVAPFRQEERGYYTIELYHNGTLQFQEPLEVIFDKNFAQDLRMDELEEQIDDQDRYDTYHDQKIEELWNFYAKWLKVFFFCFAVSMGFNFLFLIILYPALKFFYIGTTEEQNKKWWLWFIHLLQGGKAYDNLAEEYPNYPLDIEDDNPLEGNYGYKEITPDMEGKTEEEIEKERRRKVYGPDWETHYPYGDLSEDTLEFIKFQKAKPTKINAIMIISSSILTIFLIFIFNWFFLISIILLWMLTIWYNRNLLAWFNAWNSKYKNRQSLEPDLKESKETKVSKESGDENE